MKHQNLYFKVLWTAIAGLMAWNTVSRLHVPAVHAQPARPQYTVESVVVDLTSKQYQSNLATALNGGVAKGRELVTVIALQDQPGRYLAVYK
jgi:hypothetical protein